MGYCVFEVSSKSNKWFNGFIFIHLMEEDFDFFFHPTADVGKDVLKTLIDIKRVIDEDLKITDNSDEFIFS